MGTPQKVLIQPKRRLMAKYHVDRDTNYMYKMWGTTKLITDYWKGPAGSDAPEEYDLSEVMHHRAKKNKEQNDGELFENNVNLDGRDLYDDIPERF